MPDKTFPLTIEGSFDAISQTQGWLKRIAAASEISQYYCPSPSPTLEDPQADLRALTTEALGLAVAVPASFPSMLRAIINASIPFTFLLFGDWNVKRKKRSTVPRHGLEQT